MKSIEKISIAYKKLPDFHSFWAFDNGHQWLFINDKTPEGGINRVIEQLNEKLGGQWQASDETYELINEASKDSPFSSKLLEIGVSVNTEWTQKVA